MIKSLPATTDISEAFPLWIKQHTTSQSLVMDVGAGRGRIPGPSLIKPHIGHLVGVDPDPDIAHNPYLDEWYCATLEDFAHSSKNTFDVLYCIFVLEHVNHPEAFFAACRSLLKPGGMLFAVTPNLWHYFGLATTISARLGIQDWVLDRLIGRLAKEDYHFPTTYRANSVAAITRLLRLAGFASVEFCCFDNPISYQYIIPKSWHWCPRIYSWLMYRLRLPQFMGTIMFATTAPR